MQLREIGYTTDLCSPYAKDLSSVKTFGELLAFVNRWKLLAGDAFDSVANPAFDWKEFQAGRKKEKRGVFAGEAWSDKYGAILMPEILMRIAIMANEYLAPDGCVFKRLLDMKMLEVTNGRAILVQAEVK